MSSETPQESYKPFVPEDTTMPEFTWQAVIAGTLLGLGLWRGLWCGLGRGLGCALGV